jgi:hypothetical protein
MVRCAFTAYPETMQIIPPPANGQILLVVTPYVEGGPIFDLVARLALAGDGLEVIDAGNTFNAYRAVQALRRNAPGRLWTPRAALDRVRLSRVFTCYQLAALLETLEAAPAPRLSRPEEQALPAWIVPGSASSAEADPASEAASPAARSPLLVLDLLNTFGDQSVAVRERRRLLSWCLARLRQLADGGRPLGLWLRARQVAPAETLEFQARVEAAASRVWRLEAPHTPLLRQQALF